MTRFLTIDIIAKEYDCRYGRTTDMPEHFAGRFHPLERERRMYDYYTLLEQGWEWAFEHLKAHQPKAYAALAAQTPSLLVGELFWPDRLDPKRLHWNCGGFLKFGAHYIVLHPFFHERRVEQVLERSSVYTRYLSLPEPIALAYYARLEGMEVVHELPVNVMECRVLPAPIGRWQRAENFCSKGRTARQTMRDALASISDPAVTEGKHPADNFWVILDTREQYNYERAGDALLVEDESRSQRIFHVRDGDFTQIRLVTHPVTLMDDYVSWVFRGGEGAFDFMPYSDPV